MSNCRVEPLHNECMQWNNEATQQDLCTLCDDLVNTTYITYPINEKTRSANKVLRTIWSWIFEAYGGWQYDDSNYVTNFPDATTTLTSGQSDYDLPSEAITVRGVDVKSQNGNFYKLIPITEEELRDLNISEKSLFTSTGNPLYYMLSGSSVKILPASNYSQSSSLRCSFDRGVSTFSATGYDTKKPGFSSNFHEVVAVGMAMEYAKRNSMPSYEGLLQDFMDYKQRMETYYTARFQEKYPARIKVYDATREFI